MKLSAKKTSLFILPICIAIVIIAELVLSSGNLKLVSAQDVSSDTRMAQLTSFNFNDKQLASIVQRDLQGNKGTFAVVIESLADSKVDQTAALDKYYYNEYQIFPAASLYKLFLLAAVMQEIEQKQLSFDTNLSARKSHLESVLGGPEFGYEDSPAIITYTASQAMDRVARLSDNFAAILLAEKVGWDKVQQQADTIGATSTTIKSPISTTAADIALFFRKLYQKQIVSPAASDKILELLESDQINNRIPADLPTSLKIAHKTGELSRVRHDSGIVFLDGDPYLIVLMSKDVEFEDTTVTTLATISKDVYDYFVTRMKR